MNPIQQLINLFKKPISPLADTQRYVWAKGPTQKNNQQPRVLGASTAPTEEQIAQAITEGFKNWGSPPAATLAAEFAKTRQEGPIFEKYPFLAPAVSILESSGGKYQKQPNNLLNWGINLPKGYFNPKSPEEVIQKMASGIARRSPAFGQFRKTLDLEDLAKNYAPESDNPGTGGSTYANNLKKVMEIFQSKLK